MPPENDQTYFKWETKRTLKNNKSLGEDDISAQLIKYGDKKLREEIHALIEVTWATEKNQRPGELQLYAPYTRKEINCNVAIIQKSPY